MQHTRLQAIAQAVCKSQERYQRNTLLFDQLVRLLVQGRPVAPELLAHRLHWELEEVRSILQARGEKPPHSCVGRKAALPLGSISISAFRSTIKKRFLGHLTTESCLPVPQKDAPAGKSASVLIKCRPISLIVLPKAHLPRLKMGVGRKAIPPTCECGTGSVPKRRHPLRRSASARNSVDLGRSPIAG
jgi:hypothetical protein